VRKRASTGTRPGPRVGQKAGRREPVLRFTSAAQWHAWLEQNHASPDAVWLRILKKGARGTSIGYLEAIEGALAWGWIDSQKGALDDSAWVQRFNRRSARSLWSTINRGKAERLIAEGRMRPPGMAEVERARSDGRWARAYQPQSQATVPPDLAAALAASSRATEFFAGLDSANRYAVLFRVQAAGKPETRARRIARLVAMLDRGEKIHP
jgi:uncharacterized protein YdeI (YjbR/CyaY-like superfamily)